MANDIDMWQDICRLGKIIQKLKKDKAGNKTTLKLLLKEYQKKCKEFHNLYICPNTK